MTRMNPLLTVCLAGVLAGGAARAGDAPSTAEVLGKVHQSNLKEIAMGKMAQSHGMSNAVQSFGKALVRDHSAADKKVVKLARDEKIDLAAVTPPNDARLDEMHTGTAYDDAFAKDMVDDHNKDVAEVTAARDTTTDPKLKKLLAEILPVLKKHLETAQKLVDASAKTKT
jgi:putative membrane protein